MNRAITHKSQIFVLNGAQSDLKTSEDLLDSINHQYLFRTFLHVSIPSEKGIF